METTTKQDTAHDDKKLLGVVDTLKQLRDTVRVKLHLASMDARDKWNKDLEPNIEKLEKQALAKADDLGDEVYKGAVALADDVRKFADTMK